MIDYNDEKPESTDDDKEILDAAKADLNLVEEAEAESRTLGLEDSKFSVGDQWPTDVKNERSIEGRPCLTINRMPQVIRQITNDQRQNRPSIKVHPVDDKADVDTAKIFQGLIKNIEYSSNAEIAYDTAFDGAVRKGWGFFRVITDYCNPMSFDQDIKIVPVADDFTTFIDPFSKLPDGSDANWALTFQDVPRDQYKAEYPDSKLAGMSEWNDLNKTTEGWVLANSCRVAEYFRKEFKEKEIVQLPDGQVLEATDPRLQVFGDDMGKLPKRKTMLPVVMWYKLNGVEVLEKTQWPGRWIPIIPVYGDIVYIEGKRILEGVIRHAKDPQRRLNYLASTEAEAIALAPKAPFIVAEGQIPPEYEGHWSTANKKSHAYLPYVPTSIGGQAVPPPQRNSYEPAVMAITNARMQASEDIKATTGLYDAAMGNRSNENSGIAIQRRVAQSQTSNYHFIDNLTRSIKHCGRILVDLIPKIYDTERVARTIGEDGEQEIVIINQFLEDGTAKNYLGYGQYDVTVDTGPNYATRRQESMSAMLEFAKVVPKVAEIAPDLLASNLDIKESKELVARAKKTVAPGIIEDDKNPAQVPPEAQAQMQQMDQMIQQLTEKLNQASEERRIKQVELESKERIEMKKLENALVLEQMKLQGAAAQSVFEAELESIKARLNQGLDYNQEFDQEFNEPMPDQQGLNQQQLTGESTPGLPLEE